MDELDDYSLIKNEYKDGYRVARLFVWMAWFLLIVGVLSAALAAANSTWRNAGFLTVLWFFLTGVLSCMFMLAGAAVLRAVLDTAAAARAIMLRGQSGPTSVGGSEADFFARTGRGST